MLWLEGHEDELADLIHSNSLNKITIQDPMELLFLLIFFHKWDVLPYVYFF